MQWAQFQLHADIEQRHWWFVARRQIVRALIHEVLPPSPDATIIDVGCGTGANLAALADEYRCVGIDTSAEAIELASGRFPGLRFIHGSAPADLDDELDRARLVLLMDVLEHVPDDFALLSNLLAAASPGTYFLLAVPADLSLWSEHDVSFGHYRRYDLRRFEQIWQGLPVATLMSSYYNARLYPLVKAVRSWNRRRCQACGAAGTDFRMPIRPINQMLTRVFAGEARRLTGLLQRRVRRGYHSGVSLIALLRREGGNLRPRSKPSSVAADYFDPAAVELVGSFDR
jgi:SAM-dependent methyltransferase